MKRSIPRTLRRLLRSEPLVADMLREQKRKMSEAFLALKAQGYTEKCHRKTDKINGVNVSHIHEEDKCLPYMPTVRSARRGGYKGPKTS